MVDATSCPLFLFRDGIPCKAAFPSICNLRRARETLADLWTLSSEFGIGEVGLDVSTCPPEVRRLVLTMIGLRELQPRTCVGRRRRGKETSAQGVRMIVLRVEHRSCVARAELQLGPQAASQDRGPAGYAGRSADSSHRCTATAQWPQAVKTQLTAQQVTNYISGEGMSTVWLRYG